MKHTELIERLREGFRHGDSANVLQAANAIESLQAEVERLTLACNKAAQAELDLLAERDALKLDAERYCVLRDSKYQLGEDDISVSDSSFNVFFEQDLDKAVDALRHRYEAMKGAA
jgi:FtsZ-binding cell division protein ZapB